MKCSLPSRVQSNKPQKRLSFEQLGLGELIGTAWNHTNFIEQVKGKYSVVSVATEQICSSSSKALGVEEHLALRTHAKVSLHPGETSGFCLLSITGFFLIHFTGL